MFGATKTELFLRFDSKRCDKLTAESPSAASKANFKGSCSIGAFSYAGPGCTFSNTDIGRYCSIAANVTAGPTQHPTDRFTTHLIAFGSIGPFKNAEEFHRIAQSTPSQKNRGRTIIGNDVWIGVNVTIMRGVTIGDGAVVGSNSVVTKDVAPYAIVGGSPAKLIRMRFDEAVISELRDLEWWEYDLNHPQIAAIDFADLHAFIIGFRSLKSEKALRKLDRRVDVISTSG